MKQTKTAYRISIKLECPNAKLLHPDADFVKCQLNDKMCTFYVNNMMKECPYND